MGMKCVRVLPSPLASGRPWGMRFATEWPVCRATTRCKYDDGEVDEHTEPRPEYYTLDALKRRVPVVINRVGREAWLARVTPPLPHPVANVASRAYYKMDEIFKSCALPYPTTSLHLCEAPGGFVQWLARNHPTPAAWTWTALSISGGPAFRTDLLPMDRGVAITGSVFTFDYNASADLVTADGAVEMNHEHVEEEHAELLWAQANVALRCLAAGGDFVIKFFEGRLRDTHLFIALLTTRFQHVSIIKPHTSRPTNSERYLVCRRLVDGSPLTRYGMIMSVPWREGVCTTLCAMMAAQSQSLRKALVYFKDDVTHPSSSTPHPPPR